MDVCVENVFTTPALEAIHLIQEAEDKKDCCGSFRPPHGSEEMNAEQETVAQGFSPEDSPAIADSSESGGTSGSCSGGSLDPSPKRDTPQTKPAAEKNPWSAWAWLGLCRTRE
jgi:hypothetical protein